MDIRNNQECFVKLWRMLERTRLLMGTHYKRFCVRNVLKAWFGQEATDDFIWEVCCTASNALNSADDEPVYGLDMLPPPRQCPRRHRELLRAIVAVKLGIGVRRVNGKELEAAYGIAFPGEKPFERRRGAARE